LLTSVERAQGLTGAKTSAAVVLAQRLGHWCGRRRPAELGQRWRRGGALRLLRLRTGEEEEGGAGETEWSLGTRDAVPTEVSRSAAPRPRRRRTAATWPASGGRRRASARGRERERGNRAALSVWAEREAGQPSSACRLLFSFFFEIIFPKA